MFCIWRLAAQFLKQMTLITKQTLRQTRVCWHDNQSQVLSGPRSWGNPASQNRASGTSRKLDRWWMMSNFNMKCRLLVSNYSIGLVMINWYDYFYYFCVLGCWLALGSMLVLDLILHSYMALTVYYDVQNYHQCMDSKFLAILLNGSAQSWGKANTEFLFLERQHVTSTEET